MIPPNDQVPVKLYVDDQRQPPDDSWVLATSYFDAIEILGRGGVVKVSLDNDLNYDDEDGCEIAQWMVDNLQDEAWPREVIVHTANAVARERMATILQGAPQRVRVRHDLSNEGFQPDEMEPFLDFE